MADFSEVQGVLRRAAAGNVTRRTLIKRFALLGLSVPAVSTLLAACGGDDPTATPAAQAPAGDPTATPAAPTTGADATATPAAPATGADATATPAAPAGATPTPPAPTPSAPDADDAARYGGTLRVALNTDLASVDMMWGTPNINRDVMGHVYEFLFTMGEGNVYIPDLAEAFEVSADGLTYTIPLRQGVLFHNGQEMTSADVVASLERWHRMTSRGQAMFATMESLEAEDDYTVVIQTSRPVGALLYGLGHYGGLAVIYPAEVVEKYLNTSTGEDEQIMDEDAIGTGPYMLDEWIRDNVVRLRRFEDYVGREGDIDGRGGRRAAYADVIEMTPVPDATTLLNAVLAGEYDIAYQIAPALYDQVVADPNIEPFIIKPGSKAVAVFNKQKGPFTNQTLRQAALAATDPFEVMEGTIDNPEFYATFASLAGPEWADWYTEVGSEHYGRDLDRARELIAQTDYNGETLRWITTREFDYMYRSALIASEQWAEIGLNVELVVSDWPTVITNRSDPDAYEIFSTGIGFAGDPTGTSAYTPTWPGWTTSPGVTGAHDAILEETDPQRRFELWEDLQEAFYEEVPYIQFGEIYTLRAARSNAQGFTNRPDFMVWNVWLER
jgi:peptide/nickel transport system substrate-binding protein